MKPRRYLRDIVAEVRRILEGAPPTGPGGELPGGAPRGRERRREDARERPAGERSSRERPPPRGPRRRLDAEGAFRWGIVLIAGRCLEARDIDASVCRDIEEALRGEDPPDPADLIAGALPHLLPRAAPPGDGPRPQDRPPTEALRRAWEALRRDPGGNWAACSRGTGNRGAGAPGGAGAKASGEGSHDDGSPDAAFRDPGALGWAYQAWSAGERGRVFREVRARRGAKVEGEDVIPATQLYTEPYMARFLLERSLAHLSAEHRALPGQDLTVLDPAMGAGHILLESFDALFDLLRREERLSARPRSGREIAARILDRSLFGIDVDERAVRVGKAVLWMRARERAPDLSPRDLSTFDDHLVATDFVLRRSALGLERALRAPGLAPDLRRDAEALAEDLAHASELGSLIRADRFLAGLDGGLDAGPDGAPDGTMDGATLARGHDGARGAVDGVLSAIFRGIRPARASASRSGTARQARAFLAILSRRYDIVATNPPYVGRKYMGPVSKRHLAMRYPLTRSDTFAAFHERTTDLARDGGFVAMVTMKSWLYQAAFRAYRTRVLDQLQLVAFADLGSRAFDPDLGLHDGVSVALTCFRKSAPDGEHVAPGFLVADGDGPEEKARLLDEALAAPVGPRRFTLAQAGLRALPGSPLCHGLPPQILEAIARGPTLQGRVKQGLATTDNRRFLRYAWEVPPGSEGRRWHRCAKGGTYRKWIGLDRFLVDWESDGAAIKDAIPRKYPYLSGWEWVAKNSSYYFRPGLTYSYMCYGSLSARLLDGAVFEVASIGVFPPESERLITLGILNARTTSWILRALCQKHMFQAGIAEMLPLPRLPASAAARLRRDVATCLRLKEGLLRLEPDEGSFDPGVLERPSRSLRHLLRRVQADALRSAARLHAAEGRIERLVSDAYGLDEGGRRALVAETGMPVGWLPRLRATDDLEGSEDDGGSDGSCDSDAPHARLRRLWERGPRAESGAKAEAESGARAGAAVPGGAGAQEGPRRKHPFPGSRVPIPLETILEEVSSGVGIHPEDVRRIVARGIEREGWRSGREERRIVATLLAVIVLRILGHRWPRESAARSGARVREVGDRIVPLVEGTGRPSLLVRVRGRLREILGAGAGARAVTVWGDDTRAYGDARGAGQASAAAASRPPFEEEIDEVLGLPLERWLRRDLFRCLCRRFGRRPPALQIESVPAAGRRGRGGPAFSCIIHHAALGVGTLDAIASDLVAPLTRSAEAELRAAEAGGGPRVARLRARIEELRDLSRRLERVSRRGFDFPGLAAALRKEPLDRLSSPDGHLPPPAHPRAFLDAERRYAPDPNDGVRVNAAPLLRAGLLAWGLLEPHDIDRAIRDRAEWRRESRRLAREGKIPRPGWWPE